jgi:uncharacterized membrane protein
MMESWKDPVSEKRRLILRFDIHPIVDHFSVSFAASALVLALFVLAFPSLFQDQVTAILKGFTGVLPLAVIGSFLTGLVDAKVRFRRTNTPVLSSKKLIGAVFFVCSAAALFLVYAVGPYVVWVRIVDVGLLGVGVLCAVRLGRIGQGLLQAIFPG